MSDWAVRAGNITKDISYTISRNRKNFTVTVVGYGQEYTNTKQSLVDVNNWMFEKAVSISRDKFPRISRFIMQDE